MPDGFLFGSSPDALAPPLILSPIPKEFEDDQRGFQGIPSMTLAPNGRLWACWYAGGAGEFGENHILLVSSDDGGKNWTKPLLAIDPPGSVRAYDPSIWTDPTGRIWLFWSQSNGSWDGRSGVWSMTTDTPDRVDAVWSAPKRICDGVMMCKPLADSKNRWLLPVSMWNIDPVHPDRTLPAGANVIASEDQGKTWKPLGHATVPSPEALYDEHNLVERKDGSLWMLLRTKNGMAESTSADAGKTWSEPREAYPHTSARFFVRRLQSGKLLFVKHGEMTEKTEKRSHLRAFLSDDDGKTWNGGLLLDERVNISYPDGDQNKDGVIFIIYDRERYKDREILMARFTEEDVLNGKIVSPDGALRQLVNRATGTMPPWRPAKEMDDIVAVVERLRGAMVSAKATDLNAIAADNLIYIHSNGLVETKMEFVENIVSGNSVFVTIGIHDQQIKINGDTAVVHHILEAKTNSNGVPGAVKLGVLLVWQKQGGEWKLIGRQAQKLIEP